MDHNRFLLILFAAVVLSCLACGKSGDRPTRPIEVIYYVSGVSGTRFQVEQLQAANADHRLPDRELKAPSFIVMENALQPVSAVFRNAEGQLDPITVSLFLGNVLRRTVEIAPGTSATVGEGTPVPNVIGPDVRFEISSTTGPENVGFDVSIGDLYDTNVTNCNIRPVAVEFCSTPAMFFLEDARETITGIFTKLGGQDEDAVFKVDLFVNGAFVESGSGRDDVVIEHDL